ncbi:MAG TPA: hypothetical protein VID48_09400, partial [Solirubrobacteraceae bacterium]
MTPDQPSQFRDVYRRAGARLPRLLGSWLPVLLTLAVSGCSCWAILALNRAADRTQQAQIALAEIQRNAQNAENLFTKSRPPAPPTLPAGVQPPPPPPGAPGPPGPPPPGGFSAAALQADNLDLLGALHGAVGDRKEVDAVDRELTALNEALRPFAGPGRPPAQYTRGQGIVVRLQSALNRLSQKVTAQRSRATELSNGGTLAIALLSALVVAFMLRRLDQRRRRE